MTTMYIILSWAGWGWLLVCGTFLAVALRRRGRSPPGVPVVTTDDAPGAEAEHAHEQ